jgi:hypothetical protein
MKKKKKIPEERQIALILKDLEKGQLEQIKHVIISAIVLMNQHERKLSSMEFKGNSIIN